MIINYRSKWGTQPNAHTSFACPSEFAPNIWKKISDCTKEILSQHKVIPQELDGNYHYVSNAFNKKFVIDKGSIIGRKKLYLGQNYNGDFFAFKAINKDDENFIAQKKLERVRQTIEDIEGNYWMVTDLINGVRLDQYDWKRDVNDLNCAIRIAISYLEELMFIREKGVSHFGTGLQYVMVDLIKQKAFLVDFGFGGAFNLKTREFNPEKNFPHVFLGDITRILALLPEPDQVENDEIIEQYKEFHSLLQKRGKKQSGEVFGDQFFYLTLTIEQLKKELSDLLPK